MFEIVLWQAAIKSIYFSSTSSAPLLNIHFQMRSKSKKKLFPGIHSLELVPAALSVGSGCPCQHVKLNTNASFYICNKTFTGWLIHKVVWLGKYLSLSTFIRSAPIHMQKQKDRKQKVPTGFQIHRYTTLR